MSRDVWECPRNVRRCTMENPCAGCMADVSTYRRPVAIFCNAKHPSTDWRCDRQPHESHIHRNAILGEAWLGNG